MVVCLLVFGGYLRKHDHAPRTVVPNVDVGRAIWSAKWEILAPVVAIASLVSGVATPTESAALTAAYAILTLAFAHRELTWRSLGECLSQCAQIIGGVMLILGMALGLTNYLVDAGIPDLVIDAVQGLTQNKYVFLLALNVFLFFAGALMEIYAAIVVLVPLLLPLAMSYGIDPVHFGIIFLANMEMGFLCPPAGMNIFFASAIFKKPIRIVAISVMPALLAIFIGTMVISWLPLVADYARHGRSGGAALRGTWLGYALANIWCYSLGVLVVLTLPSTDLVTALLLAQGGLIALSLILIDEVDNAYGDAYSGAVSAHSLLPRWGIRLFGVLMVLACTLLAMLRLASNPVLASIAAGYVNFMRSVPLLLVIFWFYFLMPVIAQWVTGADRPPSIGAQNSAYITFVLFEAAFFCEIMRSGIQSIPRGQPQAAMALGLSYGQTMRFVVLPQALRNMLPVLLTQTIILFQDVSLVSLLNVTDFVGAASKIAQRDSRIVEMYLFVAVVYFLMCTGLSRLVRLLQARIAIPR
jgi:His/Glu/Gln/Arg/opine family amino acid ABC transporter permease subunit